MVARHWLYVGLSAVCGVLVVVAGLLGALEGLSALSGGVPASEELVLITVLGAAAEWIVVALVFGLVALAFLVAAVVSVLRNASLPRDDRLVAVVERLERRYPILREIDAAETVAPTTEDRKRELRQRYVEGELSEAEYERELDRLLDDADAGRSSSSDGETTIEIEDRSR